jgi:hypothetical protein
MLNLIKYKRIAGVHQNTINACMCTRKKKIVLAINYRI